MIDTKSWVVLILEAWQLYVYTKQSEVGSCCIAVFLKSILKMVLLFASFIVTSGIIDITTLGAKPQFSSAPSLSSALFLGKLQVSGAYCKCTCANNTNHQPVINSPPDSMQNLSHGLFNLRDQAACSVSLSSQQTQINHNKVPTISKRHRAHSDYVTS